MSDLRFGLKLAPQFTSIDELRTVWRIADEAGFDHCWCFDHFASIREDTTGDVFEAWTLLGAMAEATSRVRVGCMRRTRSRGSASSDDGRLQSATAGD